MDKQLKARLDKVPSNWNELNTGDYIKLIQQLNIDDEDSDVKILSILTDVDEEVLDECKFNEIKPYINRLSFLNTEVPNVKLDYKCKDVSEIGNKDFDLWMKLQDEPLENIDKLLPIFYTELKDVDVNEVPYPIVNQCFFLLLKKSNQSLRYSVLSLNWQIVKIWMKQKIEMLFRIFRT